MLANHRRPPGPENRGDRSRLLYDKRPVHEIALECKDKTKLSLVDDSKDSKEPSKLTELKSWITRHSEVDELFQ